VTLLGLMIIVVIWDLVVYVADSILFYIFKCVDCEQLFHQEVY